VLEERTKGKYFALKAAPDRHFDEFTTPVPIPRRRKPIIRGII
jgi:hypothetical protein